MKKAVYLTGVIVVGLLFLTLYQTYAMFTSSVSSDTVLNLDTTINYEFAINGVKRFTLDAKTTLSFNMTIKNNTSKSLKYGIYHKVMDDENNKFDYWIAFKDAEMILEPIQ